MKKLLILSTILAGLFSFQNAYAVDRKLSDFTGDNMAFSIVSVSSATTATTLANYSTSRGALTVINISTNTVSLSTSSAVGQSVQLPAGASIQFRNNAGLFAQVAAGIGPMSVDVILEW